MSFDLDAIGVGGHAEEYVVTDAALRAYAAATDDTPGGPVFAIVPTWQTIAPASLSVASKDARERASSTTSTTSSSTGRSTQG